MVSSVKFKKSKSKNFASTDPVYPRDIWEFVAKSKERVYNAQTGALLKDVLDFQALTPRTMGQLQQERNFPKTIFPKIDPERLKPRAVSVDPDVDRALKKQKQRHAFLHATPKGKKDNDGLGHMKGHFDIVAMEKMVSDYKKSRPAWLQPKTREVHHQEKKKEFDPSRGISKAEQEEMLTAAVFKDAKAKSERAQDLRKKFHHNMLEDKLLRVQTDLALNRVFFEPELQKSADALQYFERKMVDPNLDIRVIESASPTKFFEMVHRQLNPANYHPQPYEDIVANLTPDPEDSAPTQAFQKSPYLTYVCPRGGKLHPRPGDEDRWGRRSMQEVFTLAEKGHSVATLPRGVGKAVQLHPTKGTDDSPWMGGGLGPGISPATSPSQTVKTEKGQAASIRKIESSTFITQKSGMLS